MEVPKALIGMPSWDCSLLNEGRRPLAQVTLKWRTYQVDVTACRVIRWGGAWNERMPSAAPSPLPADPPAAAVSELLPGAVLKATYPSNHLPFLCSNWNAQTHVCPAGHDCQIVVECRAQYHRQVDLQPYETLAYSIAAKQCDELVPIRRLATPAGGRLQWDDPRDERTFTCFSAGRNKETPDVEGPAHRPRDPASRQSLAIGGASAAEAEARSA